MIKWKNGMVKISKCCVFVIIMMVLLLYYICLFFLYLFINFIEFYIQCWAVGLQYIDKANYDVDTTWYIYDLFPEEADNLKQ